MKIQILFLLFFISFIFAGNTEHFGEKLTLSDTTTISEILNAPENFLDKRVLVQGRVVEVCKHRGCWIKITDESDSLSIVAKVEDGVIVFPKEASGKLAVVEGKIQKIEYSMEETIEHEKHKCELEGKEFDASKVTKPRTTYRIWAYGAEIEM